MNPQHDVCNCDEFNAVTSLGTLPTQPNTPEWAEWKK